ncbi:hypothetical protein DFH27DRAFT_511256 [Peziza echinospora]|nr:hypothetical protein DFH27DRAFT_511256 [Peziza echinospora]
MPPTVLPLVYFQKDEIRICTFPPGSNVAHSLKRVHDYYTCTCPEWVNGTGPFNGKTCGHLKEVLGAGYEQWRVARRAARNAAPQQARASTSKATGKRKATAPPPPPKDAGDDDDEDDESSEGEPTEPELSEDEDSSKKNPAKVTIKNRGQPVTKKAKTGSDSDDDSASGSKPKARPQRAVPVKANLRDAAFRPLLAEKWDLDNGIDVAGWHCSEKLDGVRAYWTGKQFQSREGNKFYAPDWFTSRLPSDITLDGELFTERGDFQNCVSIVRTHNKDDRWKYTVTYQVFDCPSKGHLPFEQRIAYLKDLIEVKLKIKWINVVDHKPIRDRDHVFELLEDVLKSGGEGLMLREPRSRYVQGRSKTLLKVKKFFDADAIVRGYEQGQGKNINVVGALRCEMLDGKTGKPTGQMFKVGSGLTDAQRKNPPKVGAIIIYKYQELSKSGNPRFPTYGGERAD